MSHAIPPGSIPPPRGLEREEPELAQEDDIPSEDGGRGQAESGSEDRPLRNVERE